MMRVKLYKATFIGLLLAAMPATSSAITATPTPIPAAQTAVTAQKLANSPYRRPKRSERFPGLRAHVAESPHGVIHRPI
jgi:hypothetical protein